MLARNHYSLILADTPGALERVAAIVRKHSESMEPVTFFDDRGYLFSVVEDGIGFAPLVKELRSCGDVITVNFEHISEPL